MTANQLKWFELQEGARHNRATEAQTDVNLRENIRHNVASEQIGGQQAQASLSQAAAAHRNVGVNAINAATRQAELAEVSRHNLQQESIAGKQNWLTQLRDANNWLLGLGEINVKGQEADTRAFAAQSQAKLNDANILYGHVNASANLINAGARLWGAVAPTFK